MYSVYEHFHDSAKRIKHIKHIKTKTLNTILDIRDESFGFLYSVFHNIHVSSENVKYTTILTLWWHSGRVTDY